MDWAEHKAKLMKDPAFRVAREALEPEYQLRRRLARERVANQVAYARACGKTVEELVEELTSLFPMLEEPGGETERLS